MYCINIHLISNQQTLNKYCMCDLLYMNVTHYLNKTLYNKAFCVEILRIYWKFCAYSDYPSKVQKCKFGSLVQYFTQCNLSFSKFYWLSNIAWYTLTIIKFSDNLSWYHKILNFDSRKISRIFFLKSTTIIVWDFRQRFIKRLQDINDKFCQKKSLFIHKIILILSSTVDSTNWISIKIQKILKSTLPWH